MYKNSISASLGFETSKCKSWEKAELRVLMVMEIFLPSSCSRSSSSV